MPPRSYATGPTDPGSGRPAWLWRFDSKWLRDEVVRRNPDALRPVPAPEVSNVARRATLEGAWTLVARGVEACPFGEAKGGERPSLDLPTRAYRGEGRRTRGWLML